MHTAWDALVSAAAVGAGGGVEAAKHVLGEHCTTLARPSMLYATSVVADGLVWDAAVAAVGAYCVGSDAVGRDAVDRDTVDRNAWLRRWGRVLCACLDHRLFLVHSRLVRVLAVSHDPWAVRARGAAANGPCAAEEALVAAMRLHGAVALVWEETVCVANGVCTADTGDAAHDAVPPTSAYHRFLVAGHAPGGTTATFTSPIVENNDDVARQIKLALAEPHTPVASTAVVLVLEVYRKYTRVFLHAFADDDAAVAGVRRRVAQLCPSSPTP